MANAELEPDLDMYIDSDLILYGLSMRTVNALFWYSQSKEGDYSIARIGDLQNFTDKQLLGIKGIGKGALREVEKLLGQCGARLAGDFCPHCDHCRQREARKKQ